MSNPSVFDTPDSPPPPAYKLTEQEFDQKTSHVLEVSQTDPPSLPPLNLEEWEIWDEAAFEAAAVQLTIAEGSSSSSAIVTQPPSSGKSRDASVRPFRPSSQTIGPLRIIKKSARSPPPSLKEKERPSWYAEAQLDGQNSTSSRSQGYSSVLNGAGQPTSDITPPRPVYERESTPPPVFEEMGPSLDGPPYEGVVLSYTGNNSRPNSPLSPLSPPPTHYYGSRPHTPLRPPPPPISPAQPIHSPSLLPRTPPISPAVSPTPPPPRVDISQSRPLPTRSHMGSRPPSTFAPPGPRVPFNPQMAYAKRSRFEISEEEPVPRKIDASAFYNSAVSSHVPSNVPKAPRPQSQVPNTSFSQPIPSRASYIPAPMQQGYAAGSYAYANQQYGPYPVAPAQNYYAPYGQPTAQHSPFPDMQAKQGSTQQGWPASGGSQYIDRPW